jgi:excinuclease ABC subunit C
MSFTPLIQEKIKNLPENPGVYRFYNAEGEILYIGKAKNLRKRVTSYFTKSDLHNYKNEMLVRKITDIQYILVEDESDALLLENNLIKEFQPKYNILLKDDKTFPWIVIRNEHFPRVMQTRHHVEDGSQYFGPYTSGVMVRTILELVRQLYKLRTCAHALTPENIARMKFKKCLEFDIGNCLAPCIALQTEEEYSLSIQQIREILKGNYQQVIQQLRGLMKELAEKYYFEQAELVRIKIEILEKYKGKSTIVNPRINNVDVYSFVGAGNKAYVNFLKIVQGAIVQSHNLEVVKRIEEMDEEILASVIFSLRRRFNSDATEIIVPFKPSIEIKHIEWTIPNKGDKKRLLDLSERNASSYQRDRSLVSEALMNRERRTPLVEALKRDLNLPATPERIECFDNSNIQGTNPVSSCVVFINGKPSKADYRHYNVKTVEGANDFASMEEIVFRRYDRLIREEKQLPDLVVIDGGKGQLGAAWKSLQKLNIHHRMAVIGIAKRLEEIYKPGDSVPLYLDKNSPSLRLIQRIRDEAHRFGITFHRNKRSAGFLQSQLDEVKGIGEITKERILKKTRDLEQLGNMNLEELEAIAGKRGANILYAFFQTRKGE